MKLIRCRVKGYKSIKDTGDCWMASDITVLAGKNESGKTALLEALHYFDKDVSELDGSGNIMRRLFVRFLTLSSPQLSLTRRGYELCDLIAERLENAGLVLAGWLRSYRCSD